MLITLTLSEVIVFMTSQNQNRLVSRASTAHRGVTRLLNSLEKQDGTVCCYGGEASRALSSPTSCCFVDQTKHAAKTKGSHWPAQLGTIITEMAEDR